MYDVKGNPKWELNGSWDKELWATKLDDRGKAISGDTRLLWKSNPVS